MIIDNGGPAFPHMEQRASKAGPYITETVSWGGVSVLDWFAGKALEGELASRGQDEVELWVDLDALADRCYEIASTMVSKRAEIQEQIAKVMKKKGGKA